MAATIDFSPLRRARGNAVLIALVVLVLLSIGGAAAWYFLVRKPAVEPTLEQAPTMSANAEPGAATAPADATPAPGAVDKLNSLSVDQLFKEARTALNEQRLVAPASNNALEFYLKILEKEPGNSGAQEALRELFTFAASAAEQDINARNIDGAQRVIELLTKVDANNYTLTILRSKLDAQRKIVDREAAQAQAQADAAARRAAEPAATAAATPAAGTAPAAGTSSGASTPSAPSTPGATPPAAASTTPADSAATAAATPAPAAPAPAAGGETRDAVLVGQAQPVYPTTAVRRRQEGWVMVEFTVTTTGGVANARVVDSDPPRTFDRAALDAVQKWTFRPAVRNGDPVDATVRRRIEFKM
ncbi:energy transducer TonB [Tahibacter soli]|jgi:protein TonB|uniref:Protein TonB n=1 Tax=Tahibacter soli TaxID=2983605 RepID=A0A9X3YGK6_9GAMM|nr:energy transducer TonB [Tahibacter soli]MDC8011254.1 energy transducer TonB [Tahibacter soli]